MAKRGAAIAPAKWVVHPPHSNPAQLAFWPLPVGQCPINNILPMSAMAALTFGAGAPYRVWLKAPESLQTNSLASLPAAERHRVDDAAAARDARRPIPASALATSMPPLAIADRIRPGLGPIRPGCDERCATLARIGSTLGYVGQFRA